MRRLLVLCLLFPIPALAETGWATTAADALRWPDTTIVSLSVKPGDEVEVLVHDGDKVRVRKATDFGWLPASAVSATKPADPSAPPVEVQLPVDGSTPVELPAPN